MMKKILVYLSVFIVFFSMHIYKGNCQDFDLVIKESNLHYNEEYIIIYGQDCKLYDSTQVAVLVYKDFLKPPERVEMEKIVGEWKVGYVLSDTSVKMILIAFQALDDSGKPIPENIDTNNRQYWSMRVFNKNGDPVRGANMAEALSYTGLGDLREIDLDLALEYLEKELSLYPDNYSALKLKYSILFRRYEYSSYIRGKIDSEVMNLLDEKPNSKERLNFAYEIYKMIGNSDKVKEIEKRIIALDPKGERAAAQRLSKIMNIEESGIRLDSLEIFLQEFLNSRFTEFVLSGITTAAIELDDTEKMKKIGDILLKKASQPTGAGSLAGIAGIFTEKKEDVKRAVIYAEKAVDLAESFGEKSPPPEISLEEWKYHNQRLIARYQDVLGWALCKYGKLMEGIRYLEKAALIMPQSSTYFHYGKALLMQEGGGIDFEIQEPDTGKESIIVTHGLGKAMEYLAGATVFGGEKGEEAYDLLHSMWIKAGKDTTLLKIFIEKQRNRIEKEFKQRILSKRDIKPAPDFDLEDIKGDWVRLSDQKGTVMVLGFWATWSKSSLKMLNLLVELADIYGDSVLFITISTDFDWRRAEDFVRKTHFPLPVLFNDDTDKQYGMYGVPAVVVIDKELNIHFEHKGYSENIMEVLAIEIESLLK